MRAPLLLAALLAATAIATPARAGDKSAADEHFQRGKDLLAAGKTAAACDELGLAEAADPTVGTLGLLAGCHEKLGKVATAYFEYLATEKRAKAAGDARGDFARKQADRLEPTLPKVMIEGISPAPPGLVVLLDDKDVPADRLRGDVPVDPGAHKLEARAEGRPPFVTTFEGVAGRRARVTVVFAAASPTAPALVAPAQAPTAAVDADAPARPWQRPLGFAALGLGGASLVVSGIFGGLAISNKNASDNCTSPACKKTNESAFTDASVSTATFIAGVALAGGGVALVLTAPKSRAAADAGVRIGPTASTSGAGLSLGGAF